MKRPDTGPAAEGPACPAPRGVSDRIVLGHGSGGRLSAQLLRDVFLPELSNPVLARLDDQAVVSLNGHRLAFTTDSFVVKPLFFPGGDIGSLAVHGTVNDLAMGGARPLWLSAAFIIEEGLLIADLRRAVRSLRRAAEQVGVPVVTADTKVVERGSGDGLFINTSGIGLVPNDIALSADGARPGDRILVSGAIGEHGIAVMAAREGLEFEGPMSSDSAPLHGLVQRILDATRAVHCLRDPTRGGLSSALNEIAAQSRVAMDVDERAIPVRDTVRGACEVLGLDPLYVANEGKLVAIVPPEAADLALQAMRSHELGRDAAIIGSVAGGPAGTVRMRTTIGATRTVDLLAADQLPRIC